MRRLSVRPGTRKPAMSCLCVGSGDPLLFLPGPAAHHGAPARAGPDGRGRTQLRSFAGTHGVWCVNRRAGLAVGVTVAHLAEDYADGMSQWSRGPVDVLGVSTGAAWRHSLPPSTRACAPPGAGVLGLPAGVGGPPGPAGIDDTSGGGRPPRSGVAMFALLGGGPVAREVWAVMGWLLGPVMFRDGAPDMCATIEAEDVFDLTDRLPEVHVPTLVVGGDRDAPYGPEIFRETAHGLPKGRLLLSEGTGHVGVQSQRRFSCENLEFLESGTGQRMAGSTQGTEGGQP